MKIENGGYIRVPKPNSRLRLNRILDQYDDVKKMMGKYTSKERPLHIANASVNQKMNEEQQELKEKDGFLKFMDGLDRDPMVVPKSLNDEILDCSL